MARRPGLPGTTIGLGDIDLRSAEISISTKIRRARLSHGSMDAVSAPTFPGDAVPIRRAVRSINLSATGTSALGSVPGESRRADPVRSTDRCGRMGCSWTARRRGRVRYPAIIVSTQAHADRLEQQDSRPRRQLAAGFRAQTLMQALRTSWSWSVRDRDGRRRRKRAT